MDIAKSHGWVGACLILLAGASISDENAECMSAVSVPDAPGQSMLQVKREASLENVQEQSLLQVKRKASVENVPAASQKESQVVAVETQPGCLGSQATLDERGYQSVAKSCCQREMDVYVRRVIENLNLNLCDEGGLLNLLSLYTTCGKGDRDFASLSSHISDTTSPCSFVSTPGSCPSTPRLSVCLGDPGPETHRRRHCKTLIQAGEAARAKPQTAFVQAEAHSVAPAALDAEAAPVSLLAVLSPAAVAAVAAAATAKLKQTGIETLRQARIADSRAAADAAAITAKATACVLPPNAVWCEVRLKNLPPYWIAAYDWTKTPDVVSKQVCLAGYWDDDDMSVFGTPGHALDIGGNIGYYTYALAQAGWTVTTFEPMQPNLDLHGATLCRNPQLAAKVKINWFGLGARPQVCRMMAPGFNRGDGFTRCESDNVIPANDEDTFVEIGRFNIKRLDQALVELGVTKVDLVKIDVEGYEVQVFAGAPGFLGKYRPRVVKSEVWGSPVGPGWGKPNPTGWDYLNMFEVTGYRFFRDARCKIPMDPKQELHHGNVNVFMCM